MVFEVRLASIAAAIRSGDFRVRDHAVTRMAERLIAVNEVHAALLAGAAQIVENHPNDERGASCLAPSSIRGRPVHLVVSFPPTPVLITVYWPDEQADEWDAAFRRRRRR